MIGPKFGLNLGLQTGIGQKQPVRQSTATPVMQSTVPSNRGGMTQMFPGVDDAVAKKIIEDSQKVPVEIRQQAQQDFYKMAIEQKKSKELLEGRTAAKNAIVEQISLETDKEKKSKLESSLKVAELADMIKQKQGLPLNANDEQVLSIFLNEKGERTLQFEDYMNGKSKELLYGAGLERDPSKTGAVKAVVARLVDDSGFFGNVSKTADKINVIGRFTEYVDDLAQKIPVISDKQVAEFLGGKNIGGETMLANLPGSAIKTITGILRGVTNPVDTGIGLATLVGTKEGRQILIDRYGSEEAIQRTIQEDPVGFASDLMGVVNLGAGLLSRTTRIAGMSKLADFTSDVSKTSGILSDMGVPQSYINASQGAVTAAGKIPVMGPVIKPVVQLAVDITEPLKAIGRKIGRGPITVDDVEFKDKEGNTKKPEELLKDEKFVRVYDYIRPRLTKTQEDRITSELGRSKTSPNSIFGKSRFIPSKSDVIKAEVASKYIDIPKGIDYNLNQFKDGIRKLGSEMNETIDDGRIIKYGLLDKKIDNIEKPIGLETADGDRMLDAAKDKFYQILSDMNGTTNKDLYEARKKYRQWAEKDSTFKGKETPLKEYIIGLGNAVNDYLGDTYGEAYSTKLKEQAILYTLINDMAPKAPRAFTSKVSRFIRANQDLIKSVGYAAGLGYAGTLGIQSIADY